MCMYVDSPSTHTSPPTAAIIISCIIHMYAYISYSSDSSLSRLSCDVAEVLGEEPRDLSPTNAMLLERDCSEARTTWLPWAAKQKT